ncbi:MAG: hypothetical protein QXN68_00385 [Thermoplasmata archaeon]
MISVLLDGSPVYFSRILINKNLKPTKNSLVLVTNGSLFSFSKLYKTLLVKFGSELIFNGYVSELSISRTKNQNQVELIATDFETIPFDRIWSNSYSGVPVPFIIADVIASVTNDLSGTKISRINVKFVGKPRTDGIQVTVKNAPEIEFSVLDWKNNTPKYQQYVSLPNDYKFPNISFTGVSKPVYEWLKELSNDVYHQQIGVSFVYFLDENLNFVWFAPNSGLYSDLILKSTYNIKYSTEDEVNYLIAYCGDDLNGAPIYISYYKENSGSPNLKDAYKQWADISQIVQSLGISDNNQFRNKAKEIGMSRAKAYFNRLDSGKLSGSFESNERLARVGQIFVLNHVELSLSKKCLITSENIEVDKNNIIFRYTFEEVV